MARDMVVVASGMVLVRKTDKAFGMKQMIDGKFLTGTPKHEVDYWLPRSQVEEAPEDIGEETLACQKSAAGETWYKRTDSQDEKGLVCPKYWYCGGHKGSWVQVDYWCLTEEIREAFYHLDRGKQTRGRSKIDWSMKQNFKISEDEQ